MCYLSVWLTVCFSVRRNTREHTLPCIFSSCALDGQACACHTKFRMESSISTFNMYFTTSQRHCISDWLDLVKCDVEREQISEENNRPSEQAMRAGERKKNAFPFSKYRRCDIATFVLRRCLTNCCNLKWKHFGWWQTADTISSTRLPNKAHRDDTVWCCWVTS